MIPRKLKSTNIAIHGYHGYQNTGDDLFCYIGAAAAKKYWRTEKIAFLTSQSIVLPKDIEYRQPPKQVFKGQWLANATLMSMRADKIIYMGGSLFHSGPKLLDIRQVHNILGRISPSKLAAIGISIGPFESEADYQWLKSFLRKFSYLAFRDNKSYDIALKMQLPGKLVQAFDIAGLLSDTEAADNTTEKIKAENYRLGISICHYERFTGKNISFEIKREEILLEALKRLAQKQDIEMNLFVFNGHSLYGDRSLTQYFAKELTPFARIKFHDYNPNPMEVWQKIKTCDGFVGVRLHSGILAYMARIPFVLIEYHPKCTEFLDYIGYPDEIRLSDRTPDSEEAFAVLEKALFDTPNYQLAKMDTKTASELALHNFTSAPWYPQ
jgi:polysaccharide pyruvyl transferase WcaK-like protein